MIQSFIHLFVENLTSPIRLNFSAGPENVEDHGISPADDDIFESDEPGLPVNEDDFEDFFRQGVVEVNSRFSKPIHTLSIFSGKALRDFSLRRFLFWFHSLEVWYPRAAFCCRCPFIDVVVGPSPFGSHPTMWVAVACHRDSKGMHLL